MPPASEGDAPARQHQRTMRVAVPRVRKDHAAAPQLAPTIFHEPWWLDIACGGRHREVTVSLGGVVVGRLPYMFSRHALGIKSVSMPFMTHVLGPALMTEAAGGKASHILRQVSITRDLIAQLPKASRVSFRLHGGIDNTLAFDAAGFSNSVGFTVEIPPNQPDVMWRQMRDKTRNVIRRAQERLTVTDSFEPGQFLNFYEDNLREKGVRNYYNRSLCVDIMTECLSRGVGGFLRTMAISGRTQSAIFTIWDRNREYYFMSTRRGDSMSGATSLAIWTAIQRAALKGLIFDMDGVHVQYNRLPNFGLLTGFGGVTKPRYVVSRAPAILQVANIVKTALIRRRAKLVVDRQSRPIVRPRTLLG